MDEKYEVCGFYDQAFCISAEIISFDFDICTDPTQGFNCLPECVSTRHQTGSSFYTELVSDSFQTVSKMESTVRLQSPVVQTIFICRLWSFI